jgi:hypothetical protein
MTTTALTYPTAQRRLRRVVYAGAGPAAPARSPNAVKREYTRFQRLGVATLSFLTAVRMFTHLYDQIGKTCLEYRWTTVV